MKNNYIIYILILLWPSYDSFGQYLTLDGKQFKNSDGTSFYPKVCNYIVDLTYDSANNVFFIAPHGAYGTTPDYECLSQNNCLEWLQYDFHEMKQMGFNAIRIMGLFPSKSPHKIDNTTCPLDEKNYSKFKLIASNFPNRNVCAYFDFDISQPYDPAINPNLQQYFTWIQQILDAALAEQMKIILVSGGGDYFINEIMAPDPNYPVTSIKEQHAMDYQAYLTSLADYFQSSSTLFAYDLINEPGGIQDIFHKKGEVCKWVTWWYDALKRNDHAPFVTIGLQGSDDVFIWDPSILKIDFVSEHIYPIFKPNEYSNISTAVNIARNRYINQLAWLKNNLAMPWIIGETGFVADDDVPSSYQELPYVFGSENDQSDFAEYSINESYFAGASGYSWWMFQNVAWFPPSFRNDYSQNWYGILRFANPDALGEYKISDRKPAVNKINQFSTNNSGTFSGPDNNYYNLFLHPPSVNSVSGQVIDQDGNSIKDAVILGWTILEPGPSQSRPLDGAKVDLHTTYSNEFGNFHLIPYDYEGVQERNYIEVFRISAPGTEVYYVNWIANNATSHWFHPEDPLDPVYNLGNQYQLKRESFLYDTQIKNITVSSGVHRIFKSWNTLTVNNVAVLQGASAEFKAREEVVINGEFSAKEDSECHIYNDITFPDCPSLNTFERTKAENSSHLVQNEVQSVREIEVLFSSNLFQIEVIPNPNTGIFVVKLLEEGSNLNEFKLMNSIGVNVWELSSSESTIHINAAGMAKGVYILKVANNKKVLSTKILIN